MGNRAVITFADKKEIEKYVKDPSRPMHLEGFVAENKDRTGVYLHWNGGYDSVKPFCMACRKLGFRGPAGDSYGIACFVQLARNFFGLDGLSVGVNNIGRLDCDNYDNGVFVVDDEWEIIGREFEHGEQTRDDEYYDKFCKYLVDLSKAMDDARRKFETDNA